jgi:beta-lactamase regulating signal transducer with metallopeptidase domain
MEALLHISPSLAALAVSTLFSAIWEGSVLAICVVVCLRLFPGLSAAARSLVWTNVFLLLVLLQVIPYFGMHLFTGSVVKPARVQLDLVWSLVIVSVWGMLSIFRGAQLVYSAIRLRRLARRATPVHTDAALRPLLQVRTVGARVGRSAELCTSEEVERPSVFGFFRPRILLPPALMERLTAIELRQVVVHEMEHLRRADDWTNLLQKIALVIFPLNPTLLWVERRLCAERELACDDSVLRANGGRKAYAICLTRLAEYSMLRRSYSLVLGAWERRSEVVRRVHRILRSPGDPSQLMSGQRTIVLTGSLIVAASACALGLARSPQLVGFSSPPQPTAQGQLLSSADLPEATAAPFGAHAQLVRAVMPQHPLQTVNVAKRTLKAKPVRRNAVVPNAGGPDPEEQQAWMVMTEWSDSDMSPHLVFTVAQTSRPSHNRTQVNRPSFAAIPLPNGWLIVQI